MKKAVIVISIILLAATGLRVGRIARTVPSPAVDERPAIEETIRVAGKKWAGAPRAPKMDEIFDIHAIDGKAEKNKADSMGVAQEKKQAEVKMAKPLILPQLFGVFSEDGQWSAILKREKTADQDQKKPSLYGKEPGYIMVTQGEAVNAFVVDDVSADRVTFGLKDGEKRSIPLFDFDRTRIHRLEYSAESMDPDAQEDVSNQTNP